MTSQYAQVSSIGAVVAGAGVLLGWGVVVGAGVLIAITAKYPTGLFVAAWALPLLAWEATPGDAVAAAGVVVAGLVVTGLVLGPAGVRAFYATAVRNKGTYLRTSRIRPYRDLLQRLRGSRSFVSAHLAATLVLLVVFATAAFGIAFVVVAGVAGAAAPSVTVLVAAALAASGLLHAFPRADYYHLVGTTPLVVLGVGVVAGSGGLPTAVIAGVASVLAFVLVAGVWVVTTTAHRAEYRRDLPHLRLLPVLKLGGVWPDDTEDLRAVAGDVVLIVRPDAQYFYLAGQVRNPTPYDYPLASTFGPEGQRRVVEAIRSGQVEWVCSPGPMRGPLAPVELEDTLAGLTPVAKTPVGDVYTAIEAS